VSVIEPKSTARKSPESVKLKTEWTKMTSKGRMAQATVSARKEAMKKTVSRSPARPMVKMAGTRRPTAAGKSANSLRKGRRLTSPPA